MRILIAAGVVLGFILVTIWTGTWPFFLFIAIIGAVVVSSVIKVMGMDDDELEKTENIGWKGWLAGAYVVKKGLTGIGDSGGSTTTHRGGGGGE